MRTLLLSLMCLTSIHSTFGQRIFKIEWGDMQYFTFDTDNQAKGKSTHLPRLKDSLPDGIYRAYACRFYGKKKCDTILFVEATYVNGVRHGQEIDYGHYHDSPYLSSITLTEFKNGLADGMFIDARVNAENNVSITELKQYKNGMQNGISIEAPSGVILEVLLYKNDVVTDTLWQVNDSTNIWAMALKQPYFGGEYLQRLLKEERKLKRKK
jgi:antitoxin component YwqK of YwqJK toxin-antitoxin module